MPPPPVPHAPGSPPGRDDPTTAKERQELPRILTRPPQDPPSRRSADMAPLSVTSEVDHMNMRKELREARPRDHLPDSSTQ